MKNTIFAIIALLTVLIFISGCDKTPETVITSKDRITETIATTEVKTTAPNPAGTAAKVDLSKIFVKLGENGIVYRNLNSQKRYNAWPTAAIDENGKIYVVFSGNRAGHVCPFGATLLCTTDEKKVNFENSAVVINDTELDDRDPGLLYLGDGKMLMTYFCHTAESYENARYQSIMYYIGESNTSLIEEAKSVIASYRDLPGDVRAGGSFYRLSNDYGATWSEAYKAPVSSPHGPTLLSDGTILYLGKVMFSQQDINRMVAYKSTDGGLTFTKAGIVPLPKSVKAGQLNEAFAVELPNGDLLAVIRADDIDKTVYPINTLTLFKTYSHDKGETWTTPEYMGVSGGPAHLLVHSSGAVICTYGRREEPTGFRTMISYDNGLSWTDEFNVSGIPVKGGDLGYPSSIELSDGKIMTVFYQRYEKDNRTSILYQIWSIIKT